MTTPRERKTTDILDSVRVVFAEQGFDGASMQVLARAAGMTAGNFYRYFPSKADIVRALVNRELDQMAEVFAEIEKSDCPREKFLQLLRGHLAQASTLDATLWSEIEAMARRTPEISDCMEVMDRTIHQRILGVLARVNHVAPEAAAPLFDAHAQIILILVMGLVCNVGHRRLDDALMDTAIQTVDAVISAAADAAQAPAHAPSVERLLT